MIARKLIATFITIALYPFVFALIFKTYRSSPNIFEYITSELDGIFGLLLLHSPFLLLFGLPISIGIDYLTTLIHRIPRLNNPLKYTLQHVTSLLLHLLFGSILIFFSLISALLLYSIDLVLQLTKKKFTYIHALYSLLFTLGVALLVYLNTTNW